MNFYDETKHVWLNRLVLTSSNRKLDVQFGGISIISVGDIVQLLPFTNKLLYHVILSDNT